jgi:serine/threonine-protein kinase RsbT
MDSKAFEQGNEIRVPVSSDNDLVSARREGRVLAEKMGFSASEATLIATAISELARNIVNYARNGEIHICLIDNGSRRGITIVARDQGPGIADIKLAVQAGYSTSGGLGLGLPGVRRIMDEFDISSEPNRGTTITVTKWTRR